MVIANHFREFSYNFAYGLTLALMCSVLYEAVSETSFIYKNTIKQINNIIAVCE